jgi:8-amino-7-oxononanoate synthase
MPPLPDLEQELNQLARADRLRALTLLDGPSRIRSPRSGSVPALLSFCSNDYLGLADHPALKAAAALAAERFGIGAGASRLVSGTLPPHRDLEAALADLVGLPAALLFSTGYQANLGIVTSLAGPEDLIASDQFNHASLVDGCRLTRARIAVYRHGDSDAAYEALRTPGAFRRRLLITESLFSMDGDCAPLRALASHAQALNATFIVDEAHALGVLGPQGRGLCQAAGVIPDALVGTLGKSFGSFGGFVAGSATLRTYLLNRSRTFIYTTAPPPPLIAAAQAALELSLSPEGDRRRLLLAGNITRLQGHVAACAPAPAPVIDPTLPTLPPLPPLPRAFPRSPSQIGPIVPLILGSDHLALSVSRDLLADGLFVPAIRPPTVPEGTARLRITVSAAHQTADIDRLGTRLRALLP